MAFQLSLQPWVYYSKYREDAEWQDTWQMKPLSSDEEDGALHAVRNSFPELPLVNYTTQYALGCFEGLKAFPQPNGDLSLFRPEKNADRMYRSMEGLLMPPFPREKFVDACELLVRRNAAAGCAPVYDSSWEENAFLTADAMYIRPFSYSEAGIGVNPSQYPWVVFASTNVSAYFRNLEGARTITSRTARASKGGIGWIKCAANYVVSMLEKAKAEKNDFMEVIFLDAEEHRYVEEGSSCNIFFLMNDKVLVTPQLGDTILPGITRASILELAEAEGQKVEERPVAIDEVLERAEEAFVTGTAAGVTPIASISHGSQYRELKGTKGELTLHYLSSLKGIQYGMREDRFGWMHAIELSKPSVTVQ